MHLSTPAPSTAGPQRARRLAPAPTRTALRSHPASPPPTPPILFPPAPPAALPHAPLEPQPARQPAHAGGAGAAVAAGNAARRHLLLAVPLLGGALAAGGLAAPPPAGALPLGPLGPVVRIGGDKLEGLTAEQVKERLARDLAEGQYFVTGNLTPEIFADDCRFVDPTNDVTGLSKYVRALGVLFDPQYSKVELLDIKVTGPREIEADWRLGGYLVFPWNPRVDPFEGHTVYTLNERGLIQTQQQTWSISGATALQQSFTPTPGPRRQLF